jgi:hypothetical protein
LLVLDGQFVHAVAVRLAEAELEDGMGRLGREIILVGLDDAGQDVGPSARTLGVRPNVDILAIAGQVRPNMGGMSVAPDHPGNLHPLRRPRAYGGSGKDPVWYIAIDLLGGDLQFRQDSATHGLMEPVRTMTIDALQKALEASKPYWKKLP